MITKFLPEVVPVKEQAHFKNDIGYADSFVRRHRKLLRYITNEKTWLIFTAGSGWRRDDTGTALRGIAADYARELYAEALKAAQNMEPKEGIAMVQKFTSLGNRARTEPMLSFAECNPQIAIRAEDLDRDEYLVGVANGVVDLRTGTFAPHSPDHLVTRRLSAAFDPVAKAPIFQKFLEEVQPDSEMRGFLQRWAGYCLTGAIREHILPFHYGTGSNGKGVFLEHTLLNLAGTYGSKLTDSLVYTNERGTAPYLEIAGLCGARMGIGQENRAGAGLNEAFLKDATGGDRQKGRFHYANFVEYWPTAKLALVGNHKPRVEGRDFGFWRRFVMVDWPVKIPVEQQDGDLKNKIQAEMPGILNWAIEGAKAWLQKGLQPPQACVVATDRFREDSDTLAGFLEKFEPHADGWVTKAKVFNLYKAWAEDEGIPGNRRHTKRTLGQRLVERAWLEGVVGHERHRAFMGVREREEME